MRLVLVIGKGGVGKTTLAAATALQAGRRGVRTLVVSTDAAHSLGDVLDVHLGSEPVAVAANVDALHLDGRTELEQSWKVISGYLRRLLGWSELDRLSTDELLVVPGLDELLALTRLRSLAVDGRWNAVVVDCAPSADSLRLLSLPDVLRWYVERLFGRNGGLSSWARRRIERTISVPMPGDEVIASVADLTDGLGRLRTMLASESTTARIVVTPERVVVAEAKRTLAYLALYGYSVDAVLVNRVIQSPVSSPELDHWIEAQRVQLAAIDDAFAPLPQLVVRHRFAEPVGAVCLSEVGAELYGERDPVAELGRHAPLAIRSTGRESIVSIPVDGFGRDDIELDRWGHDLIVTLGVHRRVVRLPDVLRDQDVVRAGLRDGRLEVVFEEATSVG